MTKKDYQIIADFLSLIDNDEKREEMLDFIMEVFLKDNFRFDCGRFREWISRRRKGESMKGTNYNPKYMPLGVK